MFIDDVKIIVANSNAAAGQTEVDSSIVDTAGYEEATFIAQLGTVSNGGVSTLIVQGNSANNTTGMTAITGASAAHTDAGAGADTGKSLAVTVAKPLSASQRYLRAALTRGTANVVLNSIICILSKPKHKPTVQDSSVMATAKALGN